MHSACHAGSCSQWWRPGYKICGHVLDKDPQCINFQTMSISLILVYVQLFWLIWVNIVLTMSGEIGGWVTDQTKQINYGIMRHSRILTLSGSAVVNWAIWRDGSKTLLYGRRSPESLGNPWSSFGQKKEFHTRKTFVDVLRLTEQNPNTCEFLS